RPPLRARARRREEEERDRRADRRARRVLEQVQRRARERRHDEDPERALAPGDQRQRRERGDQPAAHVELVVAPRVEAALRQEPELRCEGGERNQYVAPAWFRHSTSSVARCRGAGVALRNDAASPRGGTREFPLPEEHVPSAERFGARDARLPWPAWSDLPHSHGSHNSIAPTGGSRSPT